jgi:predicted nucleotidyltransferase
MKRTFHKGPIGFSSARIRLYPCSPGFLHYLGRVKNALVLNQEGRVILTDALKEQLVEKLKNADPYKIILFGSHAYGNPGPESDIDLLVVTEDDYLPENFAEKNAIYLRVANTIIDIEKKIPVDLIVHTKAMHRKFVEMQSMFSRKITSEGKVWYEKAH